MSVVLRRVIVEAFGAPVWVRVGLKWVIGLLPPSLHQLPRKRRLFAGASLGLGLSLAAKLVLHPCEEL